MTFSSFVSGWGEKATQVMTNRAAIVATHLLVVVLIAYSLANFTWRITRPADVARPAGLTAQRPAFDVGQLQAANLFGVLTAAPTAVGPGGYGNLPRSTLNIVLTGVIVLGKFSHALVSADGGPESAYGIGQALLAGVTLEAVEPDRIVIVRSGAREAVYLKDLSESLPSGSFSSGSAVRSTGATSAVVDRDAMRQQLQKPEFLSQALIIPNPGGGFQVREVQPGSLYEKLGLRVGDIIRSVNGNTINNMDEVMQMYQQFQNSSQINVEVTRAGKGETLHYDVR